MKSLYETPTMKTVIFSQTDIITTSGLIDGGEGEGDESDWDF